MSNGALFRTSSGATPSPTGTDLSIAGGYTIQEIHSSVAKAPGGQQRSVLPRHFDRLSQIFNRIPVFSR